MVKKTKSTGSTPKKEPNRQQLRTLQSQERFLEAFSQSGHVGKSAKKAGVERTVTYLWRDNPDFEAKFQAARKQAVSVLEDEAYRRGIEGVDKPVYQSGKMVGVVREYSDTLLIVLLKGNAPEKYRERTEIEANLTGTINVISHIPRPKKTSV